MSGDADFGYLEGKYYNLKTFKVYSLMSLSRSATLTFTVTSQALATRFMRKFFSVETGEAPNIHPNEVNLVIRYHYFGPQASSQVELMFWNIVEEGLEDTFVHYGSDLDVTTHGSGFAEGVGAN